MEPNKRHGGPFDRGSCDSYYGRPRRPHYFVGDTYTSKEITEDQMTFQEILEYCMGYDENERSGHKKDWY